MRFLIPLSIILFLDWYAFQTLRTALTWRTPLVLYWLISASLYAFFIFGIVYDFRFWNAPWRIYVTGAFLSLLVFKVILAVFSGIDDIGRLVRWVAKFFTSPNPVAEGVPITRSRFLAQTGMALAGIPFAALVWGMVRNAYNYRVEQVALPIPNLPDELSGLKIVQISDIHTGSFAMKSPIQKAIDLIADIDPDLVFFTGDLVNFRADEATPYIPIFRQIKAKLGVFSVLGNHDYGDYVDWQTPNGRTENRRIIEETHRQMGWELLCNENQVVEKNGHRIAIIGVENWSSHPRFPRYGNLQKAYQGCEDCSAKLLLSHDPSHWRAEVLPKYPDINAVFSGHTHGLQFGIKFSGFKWSPVQYSYDEWYGLYSDNKQHLYVNPGFGYVGYPGRVGFLPEITVFTLQKA